MRDEERCRQVSILALIAQADSSELEYTRKQVESGELGLDAEFKALALKLIDKKKKRL